MVSQTRLTAVIERRIKAAQTWRHRPDEEALRHPWLAEAGCVFAGTSTHRHTFQATGGEEVRSGEAGGEAAVHTETTTRTSSRGTSMSSKRQSDADHRAKSRAIAKREQNELTTPIASQPNYQVPEADVALLASQTASWDTANEIRCLRFHLAKVMREGGNADLAVRLTKALDTMIARNQVTALKCGAYLSREAMGDFIRVIIQIASEAVRENAPDQYEPIIDAMRAKLEPYFSPEAIAKANERYDT